MADPPALPDAANKIGKLTFVPLFWDDTTPQSRTRAGEPAALFERRGATRDRGLRRRPFHHLSRRLYIPVSR